jgi:hypothetical protein
MELLSETEFLELHGEEHPHFLFHGTAQAGAQSLISGQLELSRKHQADSLLKSFGLSYAELEADQSWAGFITYNLGDHRVTNLSTATKFELAKSYAMRAPEWRYYLLGFVHERIGDPDTHWLDLVSNFLDNEPDPVVLVIETLEPRQIDNPDLTAPWRMDRGSEIVVANPLPESHRLRYLVNLKRSPGYY